MVFVKGDLTSRFKQLRTNLQEKVMTSKIIRAESKTILQSLAWFRIILSTIILVLNGTVGFTF